MNNLSQYITEKLHIDKEVKSLPEKSYSTQAAEIIEDYMINKVKLKNNEFKIKKEDNSVSVYSKEFDFRIPNRDIDKVANDLYKLLKHLSVNKPQVLSTIIYFYIKDNN